MLQFMGSQRVGHDLATKLNWKTKQQNLFNLTIIVPTKNDQKISPFGNKQKS